MGLENFSPEMTKSIIENLSNQINEWFGGDDNTDRSLSKIDDPNHDAEGFETREFGIADCSKAAERIFTPEVLNDWPYLSPEQRAELIQQYTDEVAKAFELEEYNGVVFEPMDNNILGYNQGDGFIHLNSNYLMEMNTSPLTFIDTITHEMRHQYQNECVRGMHNVSDEVRNEWAAGFANYTQGQPWAFDPWGYIYNPVEIDARFAGESVIRNFTSDLVNDNFA